MLSTWTIQKDVLLGRYRWAVPVLAVLDEMDGGARFVVMLNRLGIARETLVRTLQGVIEAGWVIHNRSHGHPLRPEYVLTKEGRHIAKMCRSMAVAQKKLGLLPAMLPRWSIPVIRLIDDGQTRFNMIARALETANPRALTQSLKSLIHLDLVNRTIVDGFPPVSTYGLTRGGVLMATSLNTG